jgi:predicted Holliday junction resolvase-like endonuclease
VQTMEDQTSDHVRYQVVVRGRVGEHLASVFDQLDVDPRPGQTSLTGNFADQAQLHGLLDQLRDLGIHLISVNPVDQGSAPCS